jgi:hypothetical protein
MSTISSVAIVGYDKCSEQDTITALEVLRSRFHRTCDALN